MEQGNAGKKEKKFQREGREEREGGTRRKHRREGLERAGNGWFGEGKKR